MVTRFVEGVLQRGEGGQGGQMAFVHYLSLLAHSMEQQFLEARDAGYRYFDYYSGQAAEAAAVAAAAAALSADPDHALMAPSSKRRVLTQQYASLALAQLHARFGHYSAAVVSLRETVRLAQQHKDTSCLRFAMALLRNIIETKGTASYGSGGGGDSANAATGGSTVGSSSSESSGIIGGSSSVSLLQRCLVTQSNADARAHRSSAGSVGAMAANSAPLPQLDVSTALTMAKFETTHVRGTGTAGASSAVQPAVVWKNMERGTVAAQRLQRRICLSTRVSRSHFFLLFLSAQPSVCLQLTTLVRWLAALMRSKVPRGACSVRATCPN
jgi:hypothetical protein